MEDNIKHIDTYLSLANSLHFKLRVIDKANKTHQFGLFNFRALLN